MQIAFPFAIGADGRTRRADHAGHVRDMMELLLFTHPGERVMRPDFGTGLLQYVFAPNSPELAATLQLTLQAALTQWLGDLIELRSVTVRAEEAVLRVTVAYLLRSSGELLTETFSRSVP
jgi:phage baseplate assembly protein W